MTMTPMTVGAFIFAATFPQIIAKGVPKNPKSFRNFPKVFQVFSIMGKCLLYLYYIYNFAVINLSLTFNF